MSAGGACGILTSWLVKCVLHRREGPREDISYMIIVTLRMSDICTSDWRARKVVIDHAMTNWYEKELHIMICVVNDGTKLLGSKMFEPLSKVLLSSHRVTEFSPSPPVMIYVSPSGIPHERAKLWASANVAPPDKKDMRPNSIWTLWTNSKCKCFYSSMYLYV